MPLSPPCPLSDTHDVSDFFCGEDCLDEWLRKRALQNERSKASRTYVVCDGNRVIGYYALAVGSIAREYASSSVRRNMPEPIPAMLLGRLAVDTRYSGRGIGTAMLRDALMRTVKASEIAGIRVLMVHALSEAAAAFYRGRGFVTSPFDAKILMLNLSHVRNAAETVRP